MRDVGGTTAVRISRDQKRPRSALLALVTAVVLLGFSLPSPISADSFPVSLRVINGQDAPAPVPFMGSLGIRSLSPLDGHFCGAVVISDQQAVTAAHCVAHYERRPELLRLTVGQRDLPSTESAFSYSVAHIRVHPQYRTGSSFNDIALVIVDQPMVHAEPLPPLAAEEAEMAQPGTLGLVLGWGVLDSEGIARPVALQQALLPVVDDVSCERRMGFNFDPESMLCAGSLASAPGAGDGVDTCFGDSGGPLIVPTPNGPRLAGITSWGFGCASYRYWGVYTEVAKFSRWLYAPVAHKPVPLTRPKIAGRARVGRHLRCRDGRWTGDAANVVRVAWRAATGRRLRRHREVVRVPSAWEGARVRCEVTHENDAGRSTARSREVGPVRIARKRG